jgi:hypothetical protein
LFFCNLLLRYFDVQCIWGSVWVNCTALKCFLASKPYVAFVEYICKDIEDLLSLAKMYVSLSHKRKGGSVGRKYMWTEGLFRSIGLSHKRKGGVHHSFMHAFFKRKFSPWIWWFCVLSVLLLFIYLFRQIWINPLSTCIP